MKTSRAIASLRQRVAAEHERRHRLTAAFDAGGIGRPRALAPADQAVVGGEPDDDVGDAAARDQRADLGMG